VLSVKTSLFSLLLAMLGLVAASARAAELTDATSVLRKLDLSSFANSTGPRRGPGKKTPEQYGFTRSEVTDGVSLLAEAGGDWSLRLRILRQRPGRLLVCFEDKAHNGGSYDAQSLLLLTLDKDGLYKAKEQPARADCPARPGQG
jgi:hypothetical protein